MLFLRWAVRVKINVRTGELTMIEYEQVDLWPSKQIDSQNLKTTRLTPLLKWAGGKEQELKYIQPLIPSFDIYYEPFVGGGAVFFSISSQNQRINDRSSELINFYKMVAEQNISFFYVLDTLLCSWHRISEIIDKEATDLIKMYKLFSANTCSADEMKENLSKFILHYHEDFIQMFAAFSGKNTENFIREIQRNLLSKTERMKHLEGKKGMLPESDILANLESAMKSAFYMHLRYLYNKIDRHNISPSYAAAIFFLVRENAYASMFRYNSRGEFNVPYGGISYNRKDMARKIAWMRSPEIRIHLQNVVIENMDFEAFLLKYSPQPNDFIFLDPPYDSEFSTYTQNEFGIKDQERLSNYLLNQCRAKFMLVIKNTPIIHTLYCQRAELNIRAFDKKYLVSFQDRNNRDAEHLIITNY